MKNVEDRLVEFPNRYKLTNAETNEVLGIFDFEESPGNIENAGTEINAELFDSISTDLSNCYSEANPPSYPVVSVNGQTGAVTTNDIPAGGTTGQVLTKASDTDYDAGWTTPSGGTVVEANPTDEATVELEKLKVDTVVYSIPKGGSEILTATVKTSTEWESQNPVLAAGEFGYDTTNKITKIGDGSTRWNALPAFSTTRVTFATAAWDDISYISVSGNAQKYFNVGDEKTIELTTGEEITLVILGFNHDALTSGGEAGMTIGMKNLLATKYNMNSSTNTGGWERSEMRTETMQTLLSQLPSDLQAVIKNVDKKATDGDGSTTIITSSDKLFLFSRVEIDGTTEAVYADEGKQYEYWKTVKDGTVDADRIKYLSNGGGRATGWWLRSSEVGSPTSFQYFLSTGGRSDGIGAYYLVGVSFGFCV